MRRIEHAMSAVTHARLVHPERGRVPGHHDLNGLIEEALNLAITLPATRTQAPGDVRQSPARKSSRRNSPDQVSRRACQEIGRRDTSENRWVRPFVLAA